MTLTGTPLLTARWAGGRPEAAGQQRQALLSETYSRCSYQVTVQSKQCKPHSSVTYLWADVLQYAYVEAWWDGASRLHSAGVVFSLTCYCHGLVG